MQQHCYFHKSEYIEHFCALKQCTLPLCEQCLQIHEDQHKQKSEQPKVISYRQAYQQVFGNLSLFVQNNKRPLQMLTDQVKKDKEEAVKMIENYFKDVETQLDEQSRYLTEIEQKFEKLKKGSIKTIIYYYSGQIALKPLQLPQFKQISSSLKTFLKSVHQEKKEQIQTFRQKKNSEPEWSQSKIQPYQQRQQSHSRKKSIFQNERSKVNLHRNNNDPYLENQVIVTQQEKKESSRKNPYDNFQRQATVQDQEKSEVGNYFQNYKVESANKVAETNTYKGEMNNFKIESKNLRHFQIESHLGIQPVENSFRPLKETPYTLNQQYRETRSRTLDKFPTMVDLKKARDNVPRLQNNQQEFTRVQKPNYEEHRPGKWNKTHQEKQNNMNFDRQPSVFSQLTINETSNGVSPSATEFMNRRPLKTTDLDTYTPLSNVQQIFEGRQRAASYQGGGLRTTVSHNNLYAAGKKMQPLLGEDLKKQVLSPHEIRRMLEKKIEERNKVLTQKKELQLKINPDRMGQNTTIGSGTRTVTQNSYKQKGQNRQVQMRYDENTNMNWNQPEQRTNTYNTKDSIMNHIYRETRY